VAGIVGLLASLLLGYVIDPSFRRFFFTYLVSFCFFLTIALGAIFFVLIQHLTRAGWSVSVRRVAEALGATMPILLALSAPILISVALGHGDLYRWAQGAQPIPHQLGAEKGSGAEKGAEKGSDPVAGTAPRVLRTTGSDPFSAAPQLEEHPSAHGVQPPDELTLSKRSWLNGHFFIARILCYFVVWSLMGHWYWRQSWKQDISGSPSAAAAATMRMQTLSAPALIVLGLTLTFAVFDLVMSLDPHWYSTIFGVYLFAGSVVSGLATLILILMLMQHWGYLQRSVNNEHYHDLGKWLFGFVFFWGYIAFSQYMLIWYASIPEETGWLVRRGASTAHGGANVWSGVAIALLFGNLLIPFAGLLSRHVKRRKTALAFWAVWLLVFHWIDLYWLIVPELDGKAYFGLLDVVTFVGIGGIFLAAFVRLLARHSLRPRMDPRLVESVAFENM
jgi:hypothetical protein